MTDAVVQIARDCLEAAETGTMTFPRIVGALADAGIESYRIDFCRAVATYYQADGTVFELSAPFAPFAVAKAFDAAAVAVAIRAAQTQAESYTYPGFCRTVTAAGCAGYLVSFSGRRALYVGRTGETHVERFPD
jgi:uncharacterized protein YbcV (DUF1398 family)